ncbi:hypothetical protein SAMN05660368_02898 [Marvinbryantia formatexigens]|nr:hypothetical protein SAMN05660368_02898 [Marvinbryantia formatexigens]
MSGVLTNSAEVISFFKDINNKNSNKTKKQSNNRIAQGKRKSYTEVTKQRRDAGAGGAAVSAGRKSVGRERTDEFSEWRKLK